MATAGHEQQLRDERTFRHWTAEKIRFQDIDRLDHVNNVTFAAYAESGRVEFLADVSGDPAMNADGTIWVIVRLVINFLEQTHYPGEVRIGTCVLATGRSSITLGQGLFEGSRCVATAESVVVQVDVESNRTVPLSPAIKAAVANYVPGT